MAEPVENVEPTEGETKPEVEATNLADSLDSDKHDSLLVKDETLLELRSVPLRLPSFSPLNVFSHTCGWYWS